MAKRHHPPENGKLGGILIENILVGQKLSYSVIGIGLNLNQRKFESKTATSLALLTGQGTDSALLLEQLVKRIEQHYLKLKKQVFADIQEHYKLALYGMETWRRYETEEVFEARMVDVLPSGHLVLEKRSGERNQYAFKEVKFLDLYT
ncbi:biotin--[acetyl-CoA-carboxylase] ligase [Nitritalea halalkaliphila]|uniref:biotin--[acetyl-CoA-carboxylase] ligase n=1 Tax=Nitritalea halalkaliphila TaxID=590849 RepID=UPI00138955AE|nr:hypothetical protein [Nitritalea halalkaliphila]